MNQEPKPQTSLNTREAFLLAIDEMASPPPSTKIHSWSYFNQLVGGLRPREFSILCGSTGSGKTTWLANLSAQLVKTQQKHFVMSVENGYTDFMRRVLSALEGEDFNTGDPVAPEKIHMLAKKHGCLMEGDPIEFSMYDNRVPLSQLLSDLTEMAESGCKVAMIDNLNFFLEVTRSADQIIETDRVIHELIMFCKRVDMHVIMVTHPKKTENTRVESEFDVKGSSTAVQEAHNVFLFNRPKLEDIRNGEAGPMQRELKIAKMRRRGKFVGKTILYNGNEVQYVESGAK